MPSYKYKDLSGIRLEVQFPESIKYFVSFMSFHFHSFLYILEMVAPQIRCPFYMEPYIYYDGAMLKINKNITYTTYTYITK